jgi:hypothetical protein
VLLPASLLHPWGSKPRHILDRRMNAPRVSVDIVEEAFFVLVVI